MIRIVDNVILLGTAHVAKQSIDDVKEAIEQYKPEVVGIELDYARFKTLMSKDKDKGKKKNSFTRMVREFGASGALFALMAGYAQNKIGEKLKIEPGVDMKGAYEEARNNKIPVSLIDQNIKVTLKKISGLGFFKKVRLFSGLIFKSMKKEDRKKLDFDIRKGVPSEEVIINLLDVVKKNAPDLYDILIHQRNIYMSKKILKLRETHKGMILAVVGAGHVKGMEEYLKNNITEHYNSFSYSYTAEIE